MTHFHFSIGPVQTFIAQSRRSRDLWAGSFLLSWLAGVAMAAVRQQDASARIAFPTPVDGVMKRICPDWPDGTALADGHPLLRQGGIPNRFMATVSDGFDGAAVAQTLRAAFAALAQTLWDKDLQAFAGDATRTIWLRQINGFWDIAWVLEPQPDPANSNAAPLMDMRKNWRSHFAPTEPGLKCTAMDGWQELSGATGPGDPALKKFWGALQPELAKTHSNDLQADESLCALAYIKRRFVRVFGQFSANVPLGNNNMLTVKGWPLSGNVPSVVYMAAAPWLAQATLQFDKPEVTQAATAFLEAVQAFEAKQHPGSNPLTCGELETAIACITQAAANLTPASKTLAQRLHNLDASLFFKDDLLNKQVFPGAPATTQNINHTLAELCKAVGDSPSRFYALLRMDGDRIGQRMGQPLWRPVIADALNRFTAQAVATVQKHSGFLLYAGGDDVLAFFTVDHALPAAHQLQLDFQGAFDKALAVAAAQPTDDQQTLTLSGAIVFAQSHVPLASVVQRSQTLLEHTAKTRAGRNALAVQVVKPGGPVCTWASQWPEEENAPTHGPLALHTLAKPENATFSNGFLQRLRELHGQWFPGGKGGNPFDDETTTQALLLAELMGTRRADGQRWEQADAKQQLTQLMPFLQTPWGGPWQADAAVLVRFLAQKGKL